ncbi:MAG: Ig-like domain-containing protein [Tannerella sp.]|nr:Ig-like domain-containing protein [Tannerella sp.]
MKKIIKSTLTALFCMTAMTMTKCVDAERTPVEHAIFIDRQVAKLFIGETLQLTVSPSEGSYTWTSEDADIATVSSNGLVTAVGEGYTNIIVNGDGLTTKMGLDVVRKIPLTGLNINLTYVELTPGAKAAVIATRIPDNANDFETITWKTSDIDVANVNSTGDITGILEGETDVICSCGAFTKTVRVSVAYTRPFKGPHILSSAAPLILPVVDFDLGGEGYAFHDNDTGNSGNFAYRANNGDNASGAVDMENSANPNIGWTGNGEWLQYTVEVHTAGNYQVQVEQASPNTTGRFRIEVNGVDRTGPLPASNTGGWGAYGWDIVPQPIALEAGVQKLKYYFVVGAHNIRTLKFTYVP